MYSELYIQKSFVIVLSNKLQLACTLSSRTPMYYCLIVVILRCQIDVYVKLHSNRMNNWPNYLDSNAKFDWMFIMNVMVVFSIIMSSLRLVLVRLVLISYTADCVVYYSNRHFSSWLNRTGRTINIMTLLMLF